MLAIHAFITWVSTRYLGIGLSRTFWVKLNRLPSSVEGFARWCTYGVSIHARTVSIVPVNKLLTTSARSVPQIEHVKDYLVWWSWMTKQDICSIPSQSASDTLAALSRCCKSFDYSVSTALISVNTSWIINCAHFTITIDSPYFPLVALVFISPLWKLLLLELFNLISVDIRISFTTLKSFINALDFDWLFFRPIKLSVFFNINSVWLDFTTFWRFPVISVRRKD